MDKITDFVLGSTFLDELPEGAKRAKKIASKCPELVDSLEGTTSFIINKLEEVEEVIILTGFPYKDVFETDGPIGALNLAEVLIQLNKTVKNRG